MTYQLHRDTLAPDILTLNIYDDLSHEDFLRLVDETYALVESIPTPVHVIYNMTQTAHMPRMMSSLLYYAGRRMPENLDRKVIVSSSPGVMMAYELCRVVAPALARNVAFVDTLSQARELLVSKNNRHART